MVMFTEEKLKSLDIYPGDDGYYHFFPEEVKGYITAHDLRQIADFIDAKNEEWDQKVERDLIALAPNEKTRDEIMMDKVDFLGEVVNLLSDDWSDRVSRLLELYLFTTDYAQANVLETWVTQEYEFAKANLKIVETEEIHTIRRKKAIWNEE